MKYLTFILITSLFQSSVLANPWSLNDVNNSDSVFKSLYRRVFSATKTLKSPENNLIEAKSDQEQSLNSRQVAFNPMDPLSYGEPKYAILAPDATNMKINPKKTTRNEDNIAKNEKLRETDSKSVYELDSEESELGGNLIVMDADGNIVKNAVVLTEKQAEALNKMNRNRKNNGKGNNRSNSSNRKSTGKGNNRDGSRGDEEKDSQFKEKSSAHREEMSEDKKNLSDSYKEDNKGNKNSEEANSNNSNNDYSENDREKYSQSKVQSQSINLEASEDKDNSSTDNDEDAKSDNFSADDNTDGNNNNKGDDDKEKSSSSNTQPQPINLENTEDKQNLSSGDSEEGVSDDNTNNDNINNATSGGEEKSNQSKTYPQALISENDENNNNLSTEAGVKSDNISTETTNNNGDNLSPSTNDNNPEYSNANANDNYLDSEINNYDSNNGGDGGEWFDDFTEEYASFENEMDGYWS